MRDDGNLPQLIALVNLYQSAVLWASAQIDMSITVSLAADLLTVRTTHLPPSNPSLHETAAQ